MRAYAGPPVLQIALARPQVGRWNELPADTRDRAGVYPGSNMVTSTMLQGGVMDARARMLSDDELWSVYRRVPDVRASVDAIVRVISTWDHTIDVSESLATDDPMFDLATDAAEQVRRFLAAPNQDGEVWQTWVSKALRDLLVFDAWATENVFGSGGELEELVTLPGGTIHPRVDRHQRVVDYKQITSSEPVFLSIEQVVYFNLFPNSSRPGGSPLIETLLNEVITLLQSSKHLMLAYDADEVAPGVLLLAGLAGKAADRAVMGLRNMRGSDHKLRVITTNNPQGLDAKWVEFRHTPKDLDMKDLTKEIRRTVWRLFGVKPITMGDSEATPRATAEVQVEAQDSGLIRPIIELLQAHVNARVLPLVVGDPELAKLLTFQFDLSRNSTAQDTKDEAEADGVDFDRGGLTINELRAKRGRLPVEGGDIALLKSGGGYVTLGSVLGDEVDAIADELDEDGAGDSTGGGTGEVDGDTADADTPEDGEEAPGEVEASAPSGAPHLRAGVPIPGPVHRHRAHARVHRCSCGGHHDEPESRYQMRGSPLLPSEWQPQSKFSDYRTINLPKLGEVLIDYARAVDPLYRRAKLDVISSFRAYTADGELDSTEAGSLAREVSATLDRLHTSWDGATAEHYRAAGRIGRDAAADFTGVAVLANWRDRSELYQSKAMSYLVDSGGLINDLSAQLTTLIMASVRGTSDHALATRATDGDLDITLLLGAVAKVFDRNNHRVQNWSGRLVELANELLGLGMAEGSNGPGGSSPEDAPTEWWVEWAAVGDNRMCPTCDMEGSAGFRPLSQLTRRPGGDTECRARCRCVLVFWRKDEVDAGDAVKLSGN